jgi:hypothetical protein
MFLVPRENKPRNTSFSEHLGGGTHNIFERFDRFLEVQHDLFYQLLLQT